MVKVKDIGAIAAKWAKEAAARAAYYAEGVASPTKDWATEAAAAESAFAAGIQAAIGRKAFSKGVTKAGTEKWQRKAKEVGAARFGPGVAAAEADYSAAFSPYRDALESIALPARGARGDPANLNRVSAIATALHKRRVGSGK